ncbi:MAG: RIP metalloprotease RseP [Clostridia bacterium]|nr:RIP metalloprotease RseP [Clostridia bacterium]
MTIILAILVFGLLILAHELGHFIVAKLVGIQIHEFSIGMGPAAYSTQRGETKYSLRWFPVGGYNKMAGMEPGDESNPRGFNSKSLLQRSAVIAAGSVMNFILAIVLFIFLFAVIGIPSNANIIGHVSPGSPAAEAGLQPGDKIIKIGDVEIQSWNDLVDVIHGKPGESLTLTLQRDEKVEKVGVVPHVDQDRGVGIIGIRQSMERKGVFNSIFLGFSSTVKILAAILVSFVQMLTGKLSADVAGPVGIVNILGDVAQFGAANVLNFTAILSLNLGLINLFPIPALDGSRLIFLLVEGLRGKPLAPEKENLIHFIGFTALILLMLLITYQDIIRLLG